MEKESVKNIKAQLMAGDTVEFSSYDHELSLEYRKCWDGKRRFLLRFNGQLYKSVLRFESMIDFIDGLIRKYNLSAC